jgi:ATP-dependent DNA ligase
MPRKRKIKAPDGSGETITVYLDKNDPLEGKALAMSQMLAGKRGRRKQAVVALLAAMYDLYQVTGEMPTSADIMTALTSNQPRSFTTAVGFAMPAQAAQSLAAPVPKVEPPRGGVTILNDGPTGKMSGSQVAKNFLSNASSFFG